jgi:hypothetical protein
MTAALNGLKKVSRLDSDCVKRRRACLVPQGFAPLDKSAWLELKCSTGDLFPGYCLHDLWREECALDKDFMLAAREAYDEIPAQV